MGGRALLVLGVLLVMDDFRQRRGRERKSSSLMSRLIE